MRSTDRQYKMHFISNIYRFIFFLILLAITIIGIITYYNFSRQNHTYSINYNMSAVSGLTHMIEEQEDSFMQCINNAYLDYYSYREGLFFISPDSDAPIIRENCYRFLSESFSLNQQITSMSIYSAYDNRIYSVTKNGRYDFPENQAEFSAMLSTYQDPYTRLGVIPSKVYKLLCTSTGYSFLYCLKNTITFQNIGAIQADYSAKGLQNYLSTNYPGVKGAFLVFDNDNNILFETDNKLKPSEKEQLAATPAKSSDTTIAFHGERYYINTDKTEDSSIHVVGFISRGSLWNDIRYPIFLILLITFTVTVITLICVYLFLNKSTNQLNKIYLSILEVKQGNLNTRIPTQPLPRNEFDDISFAFNDMLENLNSYIDKVYKSEIESQKYQLKLLQSQINPHFLFNTLETIRMNALLHGDSETTEMIYILSKILRNSIKGNNMVSVRQEIENCKNYLRLCDIQYKNLLHYSFDIDNRLLSETIIQHALIIMIENFILHGFDSSHETNVITITGKLQDTFAVFHVRDNGFGITKEDLHTLRQSFTEKSLDHIERIGLKNIYQRAQLLYGPESNLEVLSTPGEGTEIIFIFPVKVSQN